jgi:lipopolysaccharide/colanic/teichoic acid biosynthesis glycosyltransferase
VQHLLATLGASGRGAWVKRGLDLAFAAAGLALTAPLFGLIALAIRLDSPGPVFFVQERLGRLQTPFRCLKFRTMYDGAELRTGPVWTTAGDPRITRVGRILRRSRLDELPQLINVLRGEMALVGARPIRKYFADQLAKDIPLYNARFLFKPGLTGLAQVNQNYVSTYSEQHIKFFFEYYYIRNWSVILDIKVVLLTAWVMLRMRGG